MASGALRFSTQPTSSPPARQAEPIPPDLRYQTLIGQPNWQQLPIEVQRRFSKNLTSGKSMIYIGHVTNVAISRLGWMLAHALRIIGAPLPISRATGGLSVVTVTNDPATGGQIWTRLYLDATGAPQIIQSRKCFLGPTGLEEHVRAGIGMSLSITVENGALVFRSQDYFWRWGRLRLTIPKVLTLGRMTVTHKAVTSESFLFTLDLDHQVFGSLVHQEALFESEMA